MIFMAIAFYGWFAVVWFSTYWVNRLMAIAVHLGIAEETVKSHIRTILSKLDARDRIHAVAIAVRRGIFTL